jgi:hypothetical protein
MSEAIKAISRFQSRIDQTLGYCSELLLAVTGKRRERALETMLAEQCAMSLAVSWEAFIHDLLIAHVTINPTVFKSDLEARMTKSIEDKYGSAVRWMKFNIPLLPNRTQLIGMIDPKGWNITANSAQELAKRANQLLPAAEAKKFSLDADDSAFLDYLICLRNYIGHRSKGSRTSVSDAIKAMGATARNAALVGPIITIGAYLKTRVAGTDTRSHIIGGRLKQISQNLR